VSSAPDDRPALLGGTPVIPQGPPGWPPDDPEVARVLTELAASGEWGRYHGPWCERLADELRTRLGVRHVILCSSGTVAGELALRGVGIAPGDEVLLAAYDYKSNFANVVYLGAVPVLVDVRGDDCQLDVSLLDAMRSDKTRAVIASHLHGGTVDLAALREWAARYSIAVLEDACQAQGATVQGTAAGAGGDVGVWSFGGSKLLTAGRGGAVLTNRDDIAQRIKLASHRVNDAYPLSELQAALLLPQLAQLDQRHARRRESVMAIRDSLASRSGLRCFSVRAEDDAAYYKFGFWYDAEEFAGLSRERFAAALRAEGLAIDAGFPALHRIHAQRRFRAPSALPQADVAHEQIVTLHHPVLLTDDNFAGHLQTALNRIRDSAMELVNFVN
jgi:perosamine synthetase